MLQSTAATTPRSDVSTAFAPSLTSPRFLRLLLAQSAFSLGWSVYLLAPKFYTVQLQADAGQIGHIFAMGGISSVFGIPIAVRTIDSGRRKQLFFLGTFSLAVLSVGYLFVDAVGPLCFMLQALVGLSFVFTFNAIATMAADEAPPAQLGRALGLIGASNMVMNAVSTVVAEHLSVTLGWTAAFGLGLFGAVCATCVLATFRERPSISASSHPSGPVGMQAMFAPLLACGLIGVSFIAMFVFYQPFSIELGATRLRDFFIGFTGAAVLVRVGFGGLGDTYGRRQVSLVATLGYAATCATMYNLQVDYLWAYGAALGLAHGILYPTLNAYVVELAQPAMRGRAMTYYNGAFGVGTGLAGLVMGPLAKAQGYPAIYICGTALALFATVLLAIAPKARTI